MPFGTKRKGRPAPAPGPASKPVESPLEKTEIASLLRRYEELNGIKSQAKIDQQEILDKLAQGIASTTTYSFDDRLVKVVIEEDENEWYEDDGPEPDANRSARIVNVDGSIVIL